MATGERFSHTEYSNWERVDRGGGHFTNKNMGKYGIYVEKQFIQIWEKEEEYIYNSWQDSSKDITFEYSILVNANFQSSYFLEESSQKIVNLMKNQLFNLGKEKDTEVETTIRCNFPGFQNNIKCSLDNKEYNRIKNFWGTCIGYFIWFISFLLGYSSIIECFMRLKTINHSIQITKNISHDNIYRAKYNELDRNAPDLEMNFLGEINQKKNELNQLDEKLNRNSLNLSLN